jgi:SOS-response transcriptional repressor LexA
MTTSEQASYEILQFLESLLGEQTDLPDAIVHYWQRIIKTLTTKKSNWNEARDCCEHLVVILTRLRGDNRDAMRVDKAEGLVSILLGTIHLGLENYRDAIDHFERGARHLHRWRDGDLESLAYFGRLLTHKEEKNWPGALEAAQKALDAMRHVPLRHRSKHMKSLQGRIKKEIVLATEASIREAKRTPPSAKPRPSQPSRPKPTEIPIVGDIAAGLGRIADENIEDYLVLGDNYRNGADFGVKVVGGSMKGHGILSGDIALIRQQPTVERREIAAIVITTPEIEALGVLKQYYPYEERQSMWHWLLMSSNPSSEHLVVMPSGVNVKAIQDLYTKEIQSGKMRNLPKYYENAKLQIVGKFVGLVRNI